QALIAEPELVFLDEPTSGLDPLGRVLVRDVIRELREQGTTVFLNSHLLGEVEATCDRVVLLKQGRLVRELPLQDRGAAFEIELKVDRSDAQVLEGLRSFGEEVRTSGELVRLRASSDEVIPHIARWLVSQGVAIYAIGSRRKSLEEWFMEAVGDDQRPG